MWKQLKVSKNPIFGTEWVLESAAELFRAREDIIEFFEKGIFPFKGNVFKTKGEERKEESKEEKLKKKINNTFTFIEENQKT